MIKRYNINYDREMIINEDEDEDGRWCLYDDIKDSLIEWHKIKDKWLKPDDIDEGEKVLVCWAEHQDWDFQRMHIEITGDGWYWACDESPYYGDEWDGNLPTHYAFNPALPKPPKE